MKKKSKVVQPQLIGRKDKADFPLLDLYNIDVKIDTGAYSSSIHCHNIEIIYNGTVAEKVHFNLLDPTHQDYNEKEFILPIFRIKKVKSSSGVAENRIFIKTKILLFNNIYNLELNLTDRSNMKYPVLLGRKLLKNRFMVDVTKEFLSFNEKIKLEKDKK
jgi:hypothetical protein